MDLVGQNIFPVSSLHIYRTNVRVVSILLIRPQESDSPHLPTTNVLGQIETNTHLLQALNKKKKKQSNYRKHIAPCLKKDE